MEKLSKETTELIVGLFNNISTLYVELIGKMILNETSEGGKEAGMASLMAVNCIRLEMVRKS
jgi:hypothetical protein